MMKFDLLSIVILLSVLQDDVSASATSTLENAIAWNGGQLVPPSRRLAEPLTVVVGVGSPKLTGQLQKCEGDCDNDGDCAGDLLCLNRHDNEPVPGCEGVSISKRGIDFCYNPNDRRGEDGVSGPELEIVEDFDPSGFCEVLQKCQGHCESDRNCAGNLLCYNRDGNEAVPGCTGLSMDLVGTNFCYDPVDKEFMQESDEMLCLRQSHFEQGTLILDSPGKYALCEDISFCPNAPQGAFIPEDVFDPFFPGEYDEHAFGLGFFAAIAVTGANIEINLNDHSIEQCEGHALMQRFFSIIELAATPFISGVGPHQFVGPNGFTCGVNITITGPGTMGRSSHHAIHGNDNIDVHIKNIVFTDFEVAAVSLNNVDNLVIENCTINNNRRDVPVLGIFSAARFIRPYMKVLKEQQYSMTIRNQLVQASELYDSLISSISNVFNDVMVSGTINKDKHPSEFNLFNNPYRVIDGPCYAFLVNGKGPAVNGFGEHFNEADPAVTSSNILIRNNSIYDIQCFNKEIPAAVENGTVVHDVRGAVFQFYDTLSNTGIAINLDNGTYKGNVVADAQIMVAKAILQGEFEKYRDDSLLQTNLNTIPEIIISWAEGQPTGSLPSVPSYKPLYRCNGDSMHHVTKGIAVIRIEETTGYRIQDNEIENIINLSVSPFIACNDFHVLASTEFPEQCQIGNIRGISIGANRGYLDGSPSEVTENRITNCLSEKANYVIGIDIQGDTEGVTIKGNKIDSNQDVGEDPTDTYMALVIRENADHEDSTSTIIIGENDVSEERNFLNTKINRRKLRHRPHHAEWAFNMDGDKNEEFIRNLGGCPFASRIAGVKPDRAAK